MAVNYIEEYRKSRGLSIEELADKTGLPASLLPQMIQGNRYISLKNREKIAAALECRVEDLFSVGSTKDYVQIATRGIEVSIGVDPDLLASWSLLGRDDRMKLIEIARILAGR